MNNKKIAVLIPCYNESKTIGKVVHDFQEVLPEADIYVYDNNSDDGSDELAKKAGAIVKYEYKQGKGNVIRSMFRKIDADCYLLVDGDDTYEAKYAKEMCRLILEEEADMVVGDRLSGSYFQENKRKFHNTGNRFVRFLINSLFQTKLKDIMSGYRTFSKEFVKGCPILSKGFEVETEMTIHAVDKNYRIIEIPIAYQDRKEGSTSKLNTYSDGMRVLGIIAVLFKEYKPLAFFNLLTVMLILISAILQFPIYSEYFQTGLVPRFPTLIVANIILVIALLLFATGLILQVINKKQRQNYEILMNLLKEKKD